MLYMCVCVCVFLAIYFENASIKGGRTETLTLLQGLRSDIEECICTLQISGFFMKKCFFSKS